MQLVEAIQESPLLSQNGADSLDTVRSDIEDLLTQTRQLNLAAWDVVLEMKDQVFDMLEQVLKPTDETKTAFDDVREAWTDLNESLDTLRQDVLPDTAA